MISLQIAKDWSMAYVNLFLHLIPGLVSHTPVAPTRDDVPNPDREEYYLLHHESKKVAVLTLHIEFNHKV